MEGTLNGGRPAGRWAIGRLNPDQVRALRAAAQQLLRPGVRHPGSGETPSPEATGAEILDELLGHLGFDDALNARVRDTTTVTHVEMPYIDSLFQRRQPGDRPPVVPPGAENFAFVSQFVEIPDDTIFTVEYSTHAGMIAAYALAGVTEKKIPPIYRAMRHPGVAWRASKTLLSGEARGEDPNQAAAHDGPWIITGP